MSCHDIGRGLNEVVRMVISEYDKGELNRDCAVKLIATCGEAVNWCDGNRGEALAFVSKCRCGNCLKLIPKGEKLFSLWDLPYEYINKDIPEKARLASDSLCEICFNEIMPEYCTGNDTADSLKSQIINYHKDNTEAYLSEGAHPDHNNGFMWVRDTEWYDKR